MSIGGQLRICCTNHLVTQIPYSNKELHGDRWNTCEPSSLMAQQLHVIMNSIWAAILSSTPWSPMTFNQRIRRCFIPQIENTCEKITYKTMATGWLWEEIITIYVVIDIECVNNLLDNKRVFEWCGCMSSCLFRMSLWFTLTLNHTGIYHS